MKKLLIYSSLFVFVLTACTKEKIVTTNVVPAATLAGEWYGKYGNTLTEIPNSSYYFNMRSNMTMKVAGTDTSSYYFADSTYSLKSTDSFKCTYTYRNKTGSIRYSTFSIAAKYNKNFSFMSGTWGNGNNAYNGGAFFMGRKQQ